MSALQERVIDQLQSSPDALREFFGGVFYSGVKPETIAFETYFGIETIEARYAFCYTDSDSEGISSSFNRTNSTALHSKAWIDCQYSSDPYRCVEKPEYEFANVYRNQLRNAMTESLANPYKPVPVGPQPECEWQKYEGVYDASARLQIETWKQSGFTVGAEVQGAGLCGELKGDAPSDLFGNVTMAAYRCR